MTRAETLKLQRAINAATGWGLKEDGIYGAETAEAYQYYINQNTPHSVPTPVPPAPKPWYLSRAVVGILISAAAVIAERMGWTVDAETLTLLVVQVSEVAGLALAFVGTVRRRAPIDPTLVATGMRYPTRADKVPPDGPADKSAGPFGY